MCDETWMKEQTRAGSGFSLNTLVSIKVADNITKLLGDNSSGSLKPSRIKRLRTRWQVLGGTY